ncbi:hypothetical protein [Williamsia sp.]|uniref:hypothetical protein n=1 Tax=Williamsia sp. TaxID=1872085 RepID=UPI002F932A59
MTLRTITSLAFAGFVVITGFVAIWSQPTGASAWPVVVTLGILCVGAAAITFGLGDPLSPRCTAVACVSMPGAVLAALLAEPQIVETNRPPWLLSAIVILGIVLCLRGRIVPAWSSLAICYLVIFAWSAAFSEGRPELVLMLLAPARMFIGTAFALVLRHSFLAIEALNRAEAEESARAAAVRAAREERISRLADLESMVRPMLTRIAEGEQLSAADRKACALLEGQLRDQIQAAALANASVAGNARAARRRGVDVVMIDDGGLIDTSPEVHRRVTQHVNDVLHTSDGGHLRIRVLPPGRSSLISIYRSDEKSGTMRIDLDVHGDPASDLAS